MKIRKKYYPPTLEAHPLDQEISLIMMTQPPDNPPGAPALRHDKDLKSAPNSNYPFGGDKPDYGNM